MKPLLLAILLLLGGCDKSQEEKVKILESAGAWALDVGHGMILTNINGTPECMANGKAWQPRMPEPSRYYCTTEDMPK